MNEHRMESYLSTRYSTVVWLLQKWSGSYRIIHGSRQFLPFATNAIIIICCYECLASISPTLVSSSFEKFSLLLLVAQGELHSGGAALW